MEEMKMEEEILKKNNSDCHLELGDIVNISAPNNLEFDQQSFFIYYIDDYKAKLTNIENYHDSILKFDYDGNIKDESIQIITLLSRSEETGYAKQNLLLPNTWIDLHIGGEVPTIITGQITNLEEDMIEITTFPDLNVIYIDFAYKGIPEDIPIENITIREKPNSLEKIDSLVNIKENAASGDEIDITQLEDQEASMEFQPSGEMVITLPENVQKDNTLHQDLQTMYNVANEIVYGEDLDDLVQGIEIPDEQKRYSIETQVNDMLDVLLSEVPNRERTQRVKNYIHTLIERFRELRNMYSKFDQNGNLYDAKTNLKFHKPMVNHILNLDKQLKWVLPVSGLRKKVYPNDEKNMFEDVVEYKNNDSILEDVTKQKGYFQNLNQNGIESPYVNYYQSINELTIPYQDPTNKQDFLASQVPIHSSIESVIQNLDNFYSTVLTGNEENVHYERMQFVIQKYNLGNSYLKPNISKTGKKVFVRNQMNENERMSVKSFMMLPRPLLRYSNVDLHYSSILKKAHLGQDHFYLFKFLHENMVQPHIVDDFNKDMDNEVWENILNNGSFHNMIQHFILDESLDHDSDKFEKYLQSIIPHGTNIVKMFDKFYPSNNYSNVFSVSKCVKELEPFLIYLKDVNYSQLNTIRYFMKENRKKYLIYFNEMKDKMSKLKEANYMNSTPFPHRIEKLMNEKKDLLSVIVENYFLNENKSSEKDGTYITSYEWLNKIKTMDSGILFSNMIRLLMSSLVSPENLIQELNEENDMSNIEKIRANDCVRRVLTKKYMSLKDLQKDNNDEIFYDKEYDTTPYEILKLYKVEEKKYRKEEFLEFLEETLIQKHDCPPKLAPEMASDLVEGKKKVRDGEYALVEKLPHLAENKEISDFSASEKEELLDEANILKETAYYKRVNGYWVHDESVGKEAFIDNNTLLCNMSEICFKESKSNACENMSDVEIKFKSMQKKKMLQEFDERFAESVENLEEELKNLVQDSITHIKHLERLNDVQLFKYNNIAHEMGKYIKENNTIVSPNKEQLDNILSQDDFVKKQQDIVSFADQFCRDPMVQELGDSQYYLYCVETNVPLLPSSIFELARAFISNEDYSSKLSELIRKQGTIDGDTIYDKYCGNVLQKLDFVDEEKYDEQGFKLVTNEVLEKDAFDTTVTALTKKNNMEDRVFNSEETELVFKVYRLIVKHIGLSSDSIEEFVLRISNELINDSNNIKTEKTYKIEMKEALKLDPPKKLPPYEIYRNKLIILVVSSVILVSIQTTLPPFKIQKTFPGCTQSFKGFPDNSGAIEDTSGMDYIVCILNKIKEKNIKPWNSIKPLPLEILRKQMLQVMKETILPRQDLMELYIKKNEYMLEHPDIDIPKEHALTNWTHFLPPITNFEIVKNLKGIPSDYVTDLEEMQKTGNKNQWKQIEMFSSKIKQFTFAMIQQINEVVQSKGLLLKTASNVYFTENACCNDKQTSSTMQYFEMFNNELTLYMKMIKGWEKVIKTSKKRAIAPILFDPKRTGLSYMNTQIGNLHFEKNIYLAFIYYCNLDNDMPIPVEYRVLFPEKLPEYDKRASLMDKMEFLKQNGKKFQNQNLLQLMNIVNQQNKIDVNTKDLQKGNIVSPILDLFQHLSSIHTNDDDIVLCSKFREYMGGVLNKFSPRKMVAEDSEETFKLNNWLTIANSNLLERIVEFLSKNAKLSPRKKEKLETQLANIHIWNMDKTYEHDRPIDVRDETTMYSAIQFMRQSIFDMCRVYPEMIINNHDNSTKVHNHWNFAGLHANDISKFISEYYKTLGPFKNDESIRIFLQKIQMSLSDVSTFLGLLPAYLSIHVPEKGDQPPLSYYSLFTKRTLYMIYCYIWYSVLYEYIKLSNNEELLQIDLVNNRIARRNVIKEQREGEVFGNIQEEDISMDQENYSNDLNEIQIIAGDQEKLKSKIASMLLVFIDMDSNNKKSFDLSYEQIEKRITRSRINEKKMITDFLKNMDDDERRVEDTKKILKLGRWNVGLKKGLVNYDKETYVNERNVLFEQLANQGDIDSDNVVIQKTVDQLEDEEQENIDEFYEDEANNIQDYYGTDADGAYYEEDREDDFNED